MSRTNSRRDFIKCMTCASIGVLSGGFGCSKRKESSEDDKQAESETKEMIAYCGIACHECGALIATKTNDDAKRKEVADEWSKQFNADIKPEDVYCDGCLSEGGYLLAHCSVCEIRKCARAKNLVNCGYCEEYACSKLNQVLQMAPDAKKRLDEIRASLS